MYNLAHGVETIKFACFILDMRVLLLLTLSRKGKSVPNILTFDMPVLSLLKIFGLNILMKRFH